MNFKRIKETCLYVTDLQATKQFYNEKLGLSVISMVEGRHVFFRAGESVLLCFISERTQQEKELPPHGASGVIHFAFEIAKEEYDAARQALVAKDVEILHEHVWKNGVRSFYFSDPDGHLVEILEGSIWE